MTRMRPTSIAAALITMVGLAVASGELRARSHACHASGQRYEDVYYLPPAESLRIFSAGWDEALADLIWMRALVYFGDEFREGGQVRHVFDYSEAILALDPRFRAVYRWVGMAGVYRPQAVAPEDIERSVAIMQRGARLFPEDGELAWDVGAALVFELAPMLEDEAEQDDARERGMPYLLAAARLGAAPEWAALSNASLLERIGRDEQAARHLEEMYLTVDDPAVRDSIAARIRELRQRAEAEAFLAAMAELERRRRAELPYVAPSFYLLAGPRPPIDLTPPLREGLPRALAGGNELDER